MDLTVGIPGARPEVWVTLPPDAATPAAHHYPPSGWPTKDQVTYTKELITTLFLLIAVPVVLAQLLSRPRGAARGIAGKVAGV